LKLSGLDLRYGYHKINDNDYKKNKNITHKNMKTLLDNDKLEKLCLFGYFFDNSCDNLELFKNHKLKKLMLGMCIISKDNLSNIIKPSLIHLSFSYTNIDDEFIKELNDLYDKKQLKISELDISCTKVTQKCFKYLNNWNLEYLNITACGNIKNLTAFDMPFLSEILLDFSSCDDEDVKYVLKNRIKKLSLYHCDNITKETLQNIQDSKIKLEMLDIRKTNISNDDITGFEKESATTVFHQLIVD
jgi:hypothetical protein